MANSSPMTNTGRHPFLRLFVLLCLALFAFSARAFAPPAFQGDVLDESGKLTGEQQTTLTQRIADLRTRDGIWAAVYLTRSLQGETIEQAAVATFEKWKLGEKGKDNGLLVMIAPTERKMRIEVGYGLEGTITDALSKQIVNDVYKPAFRDDRFADGVLAGFEVMVLAMRQEPLPPGSGTQPAPPGQTINFDGRLFLQRFTATVLGNLCVPALYWIFQRRRTGSDKKKTKESADRIRTAFMLFGFLGLFFGLFFAVFSIAFPDDSGVIPGLLGANTLFGLIFFLPLALGKGSSRAGGSSGSAGHSHDGWRSDSSSSSWSSSDSSSSSGGGSSGGGGASGDY